MIAQIATRTVILTATLISGAIGGCYIFVFKHLSNSERHPNKKDVVFRDVCDERQKNIETKFDNLKEDLAEIKDLIRNNGHSIPRIRT